MPQSDVLQFLTKDGSKISIRPSGTEPKIKFYFAVRDKLASAGDYEEASKKLEERIMKVVKEIYPDYVQPV